MEVRLEQTGSEPHRPSGPMGAAAARGGAILGAAGAVESAVQFVRAIILAKILAPRDFGLMGMALVATQAAEALSQTGFSRALVQMRKDPAPYLNTVFTVSALRGVFLFAMTWIAAPWVSVFFASPELESILKVVGVTFCVQGMMNPAVFLLERHLEFTRVALPRVSGVIVEFLASVALALAMRSVWGMVWGYVIGRGVHLAASYAVRPYLPRPAMNPQSIRELHLYGRHIFRWVSLEYLSSQMDRIVVGRLMGADALGLYSFASRIARLPASGLYQVAIRLGFPVFSSIQDDQARMRSGLMRAIGVLSAVAAPISAGLFMTGPLLIETVLGEKWAGTLPPFRILCLAGFPLAVYQLFGTFVSAVGRPDLASRAAVVFMLVLGLPLGPAALAWGLPGVAGCAAAAALVGAFLLLAGAMRMTALGLGEVLRSLGAPVIASAGMMAGVWVIGGWGGLIEDWWLLVAEIGAGAALYFALLAGLDQALSGGLLVSLRSAVRTRPG